MELKVENFTIQLHRAEETSHEEEVKRLHQLEVMLAEQYSKNLSEVIKAGIQRSKAKEQTKKVLVKVKGE